MCQLLGISFNVPVRPEISFKGFMKRGRSNPDGWGLALFPDGRAAQVFKEPIEAGESCLADFLKDYPYLKSTIFIGHVRIARAGVMNVKHSSRSRCLNQECYRRIGPLSRPTGVAPAVKSGSFRPA